MGGNDETVGSPILLIVGPSGAGKDAIKSSLLSTGRYAPIVSHTTRPSRANAGTSEVDGVDYHFVSTEEMLRLATARQFVQIKRYGEHFYGTSIESLREASKSSVIAITDVDVNGACEFRTLDWPKLFAAFIVPPSLEELLRRMRRREDGANQGRINSRLVIALREVDFALTETEFLVPVVNRDVDLAASQVDRIVSGNCGPAESRESKLALTAFGVELRNYLKDVGP